jgi:alanine-alpha-ketoisovalerate/valine-pyruvate aminotransferase
MNYQSFTNESITMMYEAVRGALATDDAIERGGGEPKFKVRDTPDWKKHAADLEAEMLKRGMMFEAVDWSDGQEKLPFT